MKTVQEIINDDKENGSIIFNYALMENCSSFGEVGDYSGICGGKYEASHEWVSHNVYGIEEVENTKYKGWVLTDSEGRENKLYIKKFILGIETDSWKHAFNLFKKHLTLHQINQS